MTRSKNIIIICSLLVLISGLHAQDGSMRMSLEQCVVHAIENNLGIAVEILNPELSKIGVISAREQFLPQIGFQYGTQSTNSPSFSWIEAAGEVTSDYDDYAAQIRQLFPTGGNFSMTLYSYKNETNQKFQTINPRYGSTLTFQLTQPLLRNFGLKTTKRAILVAKINRDISESEFKSSLQDTIYQVEEAYWNLVYSIENLKVMQRSLQLARNLLAKNEREVDIGTLAPIEILSAQAEVASREADILQAEMLVRNNDDTLKTLINWQKAEAGAEGQITPTDQPVFVEKEVDIQEALMIGLNNRPDLQQYRMDIESKNIDFSYAKNQLLPDLSLTASYWSPGISGSQIQYLDNDPLTEIITNIIPGNASAALQDSFGFRYKNWSLGLTLSIPINSIVTRADYSRARLDLEQSRKSLKNQEQQALLEIRTAVRTVQTNYQRVRAYKAARLLAEKKLEAEEKKLQVGLTTNYVVLQYQRDLATAHMNEVRALTDYNLSLAALEKAQGTSLVKNNISVSPLGSQD